MCPEAGGGGGGWGVGGGRASLRGGAFLPLGECEERILARGAGREMVETCPSPPGSPAIVAWLWVLQRGGQWALHLQDMRPLHSRWV